MVGTSNESDPESWPLIHGNSFPSRKVSVLPHLEASRPKDRCPSTSTLACCEEPGNKLEPNNGKKTMEKTVIMEH